MFIGCRKTGPLKGEMAEWGLDEMAFPSQTILGFHDSMQFIGIGVWLLGKGQCFGIIIGIQCQ